MGTTYSRPTHVKRISAGKASGWVLTWLAGVLGGKRSLPQTFSVSPALPLGAPNRTIGSGPANCAVWTTPGMIVDVVWSTGGRAGSTTGAPGLIVWTWLTDCVA